MRLVMESESESKKQIIKSSSIIGGASLINICISLIKVKFLAILLGPSGVGLMSLFTSIMGTVSTISGMGLQTSGVRQLAQSNHDSSTLIKVRLALWRANLALGFLGGGTLWLFRYHIAEFVFGDSERVLDIGLLGVGVLLTLIASSQTALLQGYRKIGELAKVKIVSAFFATLIGLLAIYLGDESGIIIFVIATPLGGALGAWFYSSCLPKSKDVNPTIAALIPEWRSLLRMGFLLMLTGLMTQLTQFFVRYIITGELNLDSVGHFHAAWVISMTYIGFVLRAMGADYYPRLTAIINSREAANKLVNQQMDIALILSAPVLLAILSASPYIVSALYSERFVETAGILRWQVLGDIFKIISWPMGFIVLAQGRSSVFFFTELSWNVLYGGLVYFGINRYGLAITGIAFLIAYVWYFLLLLILARKLLEYRVSKSVAFLSTILILSAVLLQCLSYYSSLLMVIFGFFIVALFFFYAIKNINDLGLFGFKDKRIIKKIMRVGLRKNQQNK